MFLKLTTLNNEALWINFNAVVSFSHGTNDKGTNFEYVGDYDGNTMCATETPDQIADMIQAWHERHPGR